MSEYDLLAKHYDAVTGDSSSEAAFIDSVIKHANNRAVTLLEVACGTGSVMASLAGRYRVSGLDISPGVLTVAREKLSAGTALYLADMSSFRLGKKFDTIICVYHGINHLLSFAAWQSFFTCAYRHLNDGGVLVFDILTINNLQMMAAMPKIVQKFGDTYLLIEVQTSDQTIFEWNIELFELQPDGRYKLLTEVIRTVAYAPEEIREALSREFNNIQTIETDGSAVNEDGENRIWFVCTKPARPPLGEPGNPQDERPARDARASPGAPE
jgi:cyclopropane fatty-acyl-phospholipid synthase-like methyltransferase